MEIDLLDGPFFTGISTTTLVPHPFPIAIAGHPFEVDLKHDINGFRGQFFHHKSIPLLRAQQDASNSPGEQSINPFGLWRRSTLSWHKGAGQVHYDRPPDSDPARFRSSKGVDVFTRWQLGLLGDTAQKRVSANTNLQMVVAGSVVYAADGNLLLQTTDLITWTAVTGMPGGQISSIATDGYNVWAATPTGLFTTTRGAGGATNYMTSALDGSAIVGYVHGRLMIGNLASIYNIVATGALPAALFTSNNTDFRWTAFAEGQGFGYAAGFSGDKSRIYRLTIKTDGTGLDVPILAAPPLPNGEVIRALQGYAGFLTIGDDKGWRLAQPATSGDITIGALVPTTSPVRCFEPGDRFVWFGLTNYDTVSTGLGRADLSVFTNPLTAAWASDLMSPSGSVLQGAVTTIATFAGLRLFAVAGQGFYTETVNRVPVGTVDSGLIGYGISDLKIPIVLDVRHLSPTVGAHQSYLSTDGSPFAPIGLFDSTLGTSAAPFNAGQIPGELFEIRTELDRSAADVTKGPVVSRYTLKANPAAATGVEIVVPCIVYQRVTVDNIEFPMPPPDEVAFLENLRVSHQLITYQEGSRNYVVSVDDVTWIIQKPLEDAVGFQGICVVTMHTLT